MVKSFDNKRKLKNYLLKPGFQLRQALYFFVLGILSSLGVYWLVYDQIRTTIIAFYEDKALEESALEWFDISLLTFGPEFMLYAFIFLVVSAGFGIYITHRVVGPTVALNKQINNLKKGHYGVKVKLRSNDELVDIADNLNSLSDILKERHSAEIEQESSESKLDKAS